MSGDTKNLKEIAIKTGWTIEELRKAFSPVVEVKRPEIAKRPQRLLRIELPELSLPPKKTIRSKKKFAALPPSTPSSSALEDHIRVVPPICQDALHLLHLQLIESALQTIGSVQEES